ncbi:DNA polymerase III subunit delta [Swingsia samuiensis]|uniref:DNA polymerase III subunit delta n=1 Tax=Swingsia samuiensis TaxID=1293412 RepID=A0A4Y6UHJ5_9PROT|nr:DNA polymerase III subunit delta [Swingsia samuiensis]QDH16504.1 DNA polymerase III subunit delta [Swingsia samuiensis]
MKIEPRNVERILKDAGSWRALLFYGEDTGLIRERALQVVRYVAQTTDDPFRVAQLNRDTQDRLEEEATALSLIGGRRVVWLRDAQENIVTQLTKALEISTDTLIVIEAASLTPRSKLRAFAEKHKDVASIACYPEEGKALSKTVTDALQKEGVTIDRDALLWLVNHLGADRGGIRGEIEKLILYAGKGGQLDLSSVQDCIGDGGGNSLEDAVFAALSGNRAEADQALERALADGANAVAVARSALGVLGRLERVALAVGSGQGRAEAMKNLRPPVFFKKVPAFNQALDRWPLSSLEKALNETQALELACKQSGAPDELLCRRHIAALSQIWK